MRIKNVEHRRECVTSINVFDQGHGISGSQKAKYEQPAWWFILAILNGRDSLYVKTVSNIIGKLAEHGIVMSNAGARRTLRIMTYLDQSIHPHVRSCGIGCYDAVTACGGIRSKEVGGTTTYWLGANQDVVIRFRRRHGIKLAC